MSTQEWIAVIFHNTVNRIFELLKFWYSIFFFIFKIYFNLHFIWNWNIFIFFSQCYITNWLIRLYHLFLFDSNIDKYSLYVHYSFSLIFKGKGKQPPLFPSLFPFFLQNHPFQPFSIKHIYLDPDPVIHTYKVIECAVQYE